MNDDAKLIEDADAVENAGMDPTLDDINAELAGPTQRHRKTNSSQSDRQHAQFGPGEWLCGELGDAPEGLARSSMDAEAFARLKLSLVSGVGPRLTAALFERFGNAAGVMAASSEQIATVDGIGPVTARSIREASTSSADRDADQIVHWCRHHDTDILIRSGDEPSGDAVGKSGRYPAMLTDLADPPPILFCRGEVLPQDELAVAIVGTRHATAYGIRQTERIAHALARAGVTVISGLARGIDAAAHSAAIDGGGRTIAVLGGGLGQMYPPEHGGLAKAITADGAVLSEQPPMRRPIGTMFPQRNRLVAALAVATLVIEAPQRSGSLITARLAGEIGRDVMALPGPVTSRASRGCHALIRDGATLIENVDDILEVLGPMKSGVPTAEGDVVHQPAELKLNDLERQVLSHVGTESTPIDVVIDRSGLPAHRVLSILSVLEMKRLLRRLSGSCVIRG